MVCQRIVTEQGGSIEVHSEEGRGASFLVRLPAEASPRAA
jgi:signal transduction histidine kinase